jgi:hypothetical protein
MGNLQEETEGHEKRKNRIVIIRGKFRENGVGREGVGKKEQEKKRIMIRDAEGRRGREEYEKKRSR